MATNADKIMEALVAADNAAHKSYTRTEIETALDRGIVFAIMHNGRQWRLRRNGKTKTWVTRPSEYQIPVKAGLRSCGYIRHDNADSDHWIIKQLQE